MNSERDIHTPVVAPLLRGQARSNIALDKFFDFFQSYKSYFDAAEAISSVLNLIAWVVAAIILTVAWRRNRITGVTVGPFNIRMKEEAVEATSAAARAWQRTVPTQKVNLPRIRATVDHAFSPNILDSLVGKAILWVDDNPINNSLAVRALTKLQMEVVQETTTEAGVAAFERRPFDLVISDMGRGDNMRAGYDLLGLLRGKGTDVPFAIFAGSDSPEFRREAAELGAQLSTNDMLELIDFIVAELGKS